MRAVRVAAPLRIDGRLDESVYADVESITGFIQQEPQEGQPATEKTEAWILFDDVNLYLSARNWNSQQAREIANELRRDNSNILGNDNFTFVIDPLHDRRNGYLGQRAVRRLHCQAGELTLHYHAERADAHQQPGPVQCRYPGPEFRCEIAVGIHRRQ